MQQGEGRGQARLGAWSVEAGGGARYTWNCSEGRWPLLQIPALRLTCRGPCWPCVGSSSSLPYARGGVVLSSSQSQGCVPRPLCLPEAPHCTLCWPHTLGLCIDGGGSVCFLVSAVLLTLELSYSRDRARMWGPLPQAHRNGQKTLARPHSASFPELTPFLCDCHLSSCLELGWRWLPGQA